LVVINLFEELQCRAFSETVLDNFPLVFYRSTVPVIEWNIVKVS